MEEGWETLLSDLYFFSQVKFYHVHVASLQLPSDIDKVPTVDGALDSEHLTHMLTCAVLINGPI